MPHLSWPTSRTLTCLAALALGCGLGSTALATCELEASTALPPYQALSDTTGSLNLNVTCTSPADQYVLTLLNPTTRTSSGGLNGTLLLRVLTGRNTPLNLLLPGAARPLGGDGLGGQNTDSTVYRGSQRLSFPLVIPAGQWGAGGAASVTLSLQLDTLPGQAGP